MEFTQFTTDQIKFSHTFENKLLSLKYFITQHFDVPITSNDNVKRDNNIQMNVSDCIVLDYRVNFREFSRMKVFSRGPKCNRNLKSSTLIFIC